MKKRIALLLILVMAISLFAGCGNKDDGEITLTWYARINDEADCDEVFAKVNEYVKEKIGVNIDIIPVEDYDAKINVINASGEDFDLVYTSSVLNNIYKNVEDGNLLELDELLPKYAPKTWAMFDEEVWDGVRINGKIYGVPNQQIFARAPGFMIPTQNFEALGLDTNTEYKTMEDYEPYLRAIKEKTGSYAYLGSVWGTDGAMLYGMEHVLGSGLPGVIRYEDENPVIENQYESQEYIDHIKLREKWVKEGLTAPMEVSQTDVSKYLAPEGEVVPWLLMIPTYKPGIEAEYMKNYTLDATVTTKHEALLSSSSLVATMAAVNSETRYPEKTVEFIELLNTDPYLYNLLVYGIEGKHYTKTGDNRIELNKDTPYTQPAWAIGNTFNGYLLPGTADDQHEQTKAINDGAVRSPILGFAPDQEPIKTEIANCRAVIDQYTTSLNQGITDVDATYKEFIGKLKTAGVDKIIKELNRQLKEWQKNK